MTHVGRLTDAEASSDDRGQLGPQQRRLVLRRGCFHSHVLHHIDSRHVSAYIVLPALWERDVQLMFPRFCTRPTGTCSRLSVNSADVRSKPTFSIVLPSIFLHVMAYAGSRGKWRRFTERLYA